MCPDTVFFWSVLVLVIGYCTFIVVGSRWEIDDRLRQRITVALAGAALIILVTYALTYLFMR